jgi:hypothetical protein
MRSAFSLRLATVLSLSVLLASGCSSSRSSNGDTVAAQTPAAAAEKFPDFSRPLDSAMAQMTDEEAARQEAQLSALARQRRNGVISEAEYQRRVEALRLLGVQAQK